MVQKILSEFFPPDLKILDVNKYFVNLADFIAYVMFYLHYKLYNHELHRSIKKVLKHCIFQFFVDFGTNFLR